MRLRRSLKMSNVSILSLLIVLLFLSIIGFVASIKKFVARSQIKKYLALYFKSTQSVLESRREYRNEFLNQLTLDEESKNEFIQRCKKDELAFFQFIIEQILFRNADKIDTISSQYAKIHDQFFEEFKTILLQNGVIKIQAKPIGEDDPKSEGSDALHADMDESFLEISDNFTAMPQNQETEELTEDSKSNEPILDTHKDMTSVDSTSENQGLLGKDKLQSLEFEIMQLEGRVGELKFERDEARKKITLLEAQLIEALEICIKNKDLNVSESEFKVENARNLLEILKKAA